MGISKAIDQRQWNYFLKDEDLIDIDKLRYYLNIVKENVNVSWNYLDVDHIQSLKKSSNEELLEMLFVDNHIGFKVLTEKCLENNTCQSQELHFCLQK